MLPWLRKMNSLRRHTASSWERSEPNSESLRRKTITPTPSSIWETFSLSHSCAYKCSLNLLLFKWQDLCQSHITKYSVLDPNLSSLSPTRSWSTSKLCQVWRHLPRQRSYQPLDGPYVVKDILQESECHSFGLNAASYRISGGRLYSPSLHTGHWTLHMHTRHYTLPSSSYYLALLVTDPPNANLNQFQNPPIGQATTFQFHYQDWCL